MITRQQAMEYEAGKTSLITSVIYKLFHNYFVWVCNRRYKRYSDYLNNQEELEIKELEHAEK